MSQKKTSLNINVGQLLNKNNSLFARLYDYFNPAEKKMKEEFQHTKKIAVIIGNSLYAKTGDLDLTEVKANLKVVRSKLTTVFDF